MSAARTRRRRPRRAALLTPLADTVLFLDGGVVVESGPPQQVLGSPNNERTRAFLSTIL